MAVIAAPSKLADRSTPWWVAAVMFWLGWIFMYADRTILNPVQQTIAGEWGLNNAQVGLMSSVFFLVYTLVQVPSGVLGDKFGRIRVIVFGFMVFGLFTGLTGLAGTFGIFLLYRAMMGFGQGFYYGSQYSLSTELIPDERRSFGTAIINSGQAFGITLGLIASGYLAFDLDGGWQMPFYVFAVPTVLIGVGILLFIREPKKVAASTDAADIMAPAAWKSLLRNRNLLLTYALVFCSLYGFFVMITWLPNYLTAEHGIDKSDAGTWSSLAIWTSVPASLLIASFSDKIRRRKPILHFLFPLAMVAVLILGFAPSGNMTIVAIAMVAYGFFGKLATDPLLVNLVGLNSPRELSATAFGIFNFVGMSSAVAAPYFTGWLVDTTGSYTSGFVVAAVLLVIGFFVSFFLRDEAQ